METKETKSMATKNDSKLTSLPSGLVPNIVGLALDVADRGQSTTFAVLGEARAELRAVVDHTIELAEKVAASGFRFAKKLTAKLDEASHDTLGHVERVVGGAVTSARTTSRAAAELAHSTISGIAGQPAAQA